MHGVKYKFTKRTLSSERHPPALLEELRKAFAAKLMAMIDDGLPVVYCDE